MCVKVIENTNEAKNEHGHYYGSENLNISKDQFYALINGKCLALVVNAEYVVFVSVDEPMLMKRTDNIKIVGRSAGKMVNLIEQIQKDFCENKGYGKCSYCVNGIGCKMTEFIRYLRGGETDGN